MSVNFEKSKLVSYIHTINGRPCPVEDEFLLYDGQWVAIGFRTFESVPPNFRADRESFTHERSGFRPLGLGGKEAKADYYPIRYRADHRSETWTVMVVADEPFALINYWGMDESCEIAREVVDGEPKRLPPIEKPHFARGTRHWGWIKLTELAAFMKKPKKGIWSAAKNLWLTYGQAAMGESYPTLHPKHRFRDVLLVTIDSCDNPVQVIQSPGQDSASLCTLEQWRDTDFPKEPRWVEDALDRMFVPAGWAMNVLYLDWLGYEGFNVFATNEIVNS